MDVNFSGLALYGLSLLTIGGVYAVICLGLNVQWGFTGLFNAGIDGFFAVGAYISAILTARGEEADVVRMIERGTGPL